MKLLRNNRVAWLLLIAASVGCMPPPAAPSSALTNPPTPIPGGARHPLIVQQQFKVGALAFETRTAAEPELATFGNAIPAMIVTELRGQSRFSIYEGGGIRAQGTGDAPVTEARANNVVDAYLSGTITSVEQEQICFDVRLCNAQNHEVLFARAVCAKIQHSVTPKRSFAVDRDAIKRVADDLSRSIKRIGSALVTSADGKIVYINKGKNADVMPGMVAYMVGSGDSSVDATVNQAVEQYTGVTAASASQSPIVVGELYIVSVEETRSIGLLYEGEYALPGDTVFFK